MGTPLLSAIYLHDYTRILRTHPNILTHRVYSHTPRNDHVDCFHGISIFLGSSCIGRTINNRKELIVLAKLSFYIFFLCQFLMANVLRMIFCGTKTTIYRIHTA